MCILLVPMWNFEYEVHLFSRSRGMDIIKHVSQVYTRYKQVYTFSNVIWVCTKKDTHITNPMLVTMGFLSRGTKLIPTSFPAQTRDGNTLPPQYVMCSYGVQAI